MTLATDRLATCADCDLLRGFSRRSFAVFKCGELLSRDHGCGCVLGSTHDPTTQEVVELTYKGRDGVKRTYNVKPTGKTRMTRQRCPLNKWPEPQP